MQYFSLVAEEPGRRPRPCAMVAAPTSQDAERQARALREEGHLAFVGPRASFSLRRSSRRETELLQSFMHSCNRVDPTTHLPVDLDGLLARRSELHVAFFAALYLAPGRLSDRLPPSGRSEAPRPSGASGGAEPDRSEPAASPAVSPTETSEAKPASAASEGAGQGKAEDDDPGRHLQPGRGAGGDPVGRRHNLRGPGRGDRPRRDLLRSGFLTL